MSIFDTVLLEAPDTVLLERVIGKRIDVMTGGLFELKYVFGIPIRSMIHSFEPKTMYGQNDKFYFMDRESLVKKVSKNLP